MASSPCLVTVSCGAGIIRRGQSVAGCSISRHSSSPVTAPAGCCCTQPRWPGTGGASCCPEPLGAGKTTLAAFLAGRGFEYMTDELTFIADGSATVEAFVRPLKIKTTKTDGDVKPKDQVPLPVQDSEMLVGAGDVLVAADSGAIGPPRDRASLGHIVFPRYRRQSRLRLEPLSAGQTALRLMGCTLNGHCLSDHGFDAVAHVANTVSAYELRYSSLGEMSRLASTSSDSRPPRSGWLSTLILLPRPSLGWTHGALDMGELLAAVQRRAIPDPTNSLLPLCARPHLPKELVSELARRSALVRDWNELLTLAEEHGVGPLLRSHLAESAVDIPTQVRRQLLAVYVRHQRCNEVLFGALERILDLLASAHIDVVVLKGPALVHLVYRDPGLRPISDLDLLVAEADALRAQRLLGETGFDIRVPVSEYQMRRNHHLYAAWQTVDGVPIAVEIHRDGLSADRGASMQLSAVQHRLMTFDLPSGRVAHTLEHHDMLWHLCRHLVGLKHPFRLVWVADIIGYAETFVDELDWDYMRATHPLVLSTLSLLHWLTPLPESVRDRAGLTLGDTPRGVAEDYTGWPRSTALTWDGWAERLSVLRRTLAPPDWWLKLNYGTGTGMGGYSRGLAKHSAALAGLVGHERSTLSRGEIVRPSSRSSD